jgi:hypothetical protein
MRNAELSRNPKSAIRNVDRGPDAKNERSDGQIALGASDVFKDAMQQILKRSRGFSCCKL